MANEILTTEEAGLPALPAPAGPDPFAALASRGMSPALAIMLDEGLFSRAKQIATYLSKAEGFVPPHLYGKPESCFAVVTRALVWKLDPFAVAQNTYQTPGGQVGFQGKLVQAILESSGRLVGRVTYQMLGDWSRIAGKFEIRTSQKGKDFAVPTWARDFKLIDGLGVRVSAQVIGEPERREEDFYLASAFPLNSTLWATEPSLQIKYWAVRRFANTCAASLIMGVPFDHDDAEAHRAMRNVTPLGVRPTREEVAAAAVAHNTPKAAAAPTVDNGDAGEPASEDRSSVGEAVARAAEERADAEDAVSDLSGEEQAAIDRRMAREAAGIVEDDAAEEEAEAANYPDEPVAVELRRIEGQPQSVAFVDECIARMAALRSPAKLKVFVQLNKATVTKLPPAIGDKFWSAVGLREEELGA